jgi:hypothetical protein
MSHCDSHSRQRNELHLLELVRISFEKDFDLTQFRGSLNLGNEAASHSFKLD